MSGRIRKWAIYALFSYSAFFICKGITMKLISKYRPVLMGISIIWIYAFHTMSDYRQGSAIWYIFRQGYSGVDMFMLLSGFGMTYALTDKTVNNCKSYFQFEAKRFLRIYASFLPATLIIALVDNWTKKMILGRITYVEQFITNLDIHLWYIGAILAFYIFVPFYFALFIKSKNKLICTCTSMVVAMLGGSVAHGLGFREDIAAPMLTRIPIFLLGIYWGYLSLSETEDQQRNFRLRNMILLFAIFIIGIILTYLSVMDMEPDIPGIERRISAWIIFHYSRLLFNPILILILTNIAAFFEKFRSGKVLNGCLSYIGGITLEIYCLHEWVFHKCANLQAGLDPIRWKLTSIIVVFLLSVGIHRIAEIAIKKYIKSVK